MRSEKQGANDGERSFFGQNFLREKLFTYCENNMKQILAGKLRYGGGKTAFDPLDTVA